MPELPEVETVRRRLEPLLVGRRLVAVEIRDPRVVRPLEPAEVAAELEGERVAAVDRRGKYLIVRFESGRSLLIHLRMTGSLRHAPSRPYTPIRPITPSAPSRPSEPADAPGDDPHARAVVRLDDGSDVVYRDVRRFGTWQLLEPPELDPFLAARLGAEPLERAFTPRRLAEALTGRQAPLKAALLDQRTLAGLGNIYVDEALWRARLHPLTPAGDVLDEADQRALTRAIKDSLRAGLARQGATLRDYAQPDGRSGRMQLEFKAYGRDGEPCERCGTPIEKIRVAGRGTWFCPRCQPRPAARAQAASSSSSRPSRSSRRSSL